MPVEPLNPYIAALFGPGRPTSSKHKEIYNAVTKYPENYAVLVPATSSLLYTCDSSIGGVSFAELCRNEDFLASHIIKVARDIPFKSSSAFYNATADPNDQMSLSSPQQVSSSGFSSALAKISPTSGNKSPKSDSGSDTHAKTENGGGPTARASRYIKARRRASSLKNAVINSEVKNIQVSETVTTTTTTISSSQLSDSNTDIDNNNVQLVTNGSHPLQDTTGDTDTLSSPPGSGDVSPSRSLSDILLSSQSRAKFFWTINGKSIIIKDSSVTTNRGFNIPTQVKILSDTCYTVADTISSEINGKILIYFISRPLMGVIQEKQVIIPSLDEPNDMDSKEKSSPSWYNFGSSSRHKESKVIPRPLPTPSKPQIRTFEELLTAFPALAIHIEGPLGRGIRAFECSRMTEGQIVSAANTVIEMGIDCFQKVERSEIAKAIRDAGLTPDDFENMLEIYVDRSLHSRTWARITQIRANHDSAICRSISRIRNISLGQVGLPPMPIEQEIELESRISVAVDKLETMAEAVTAKAKIDLLVEVLQILSEVSESGIDARDRNNTSGNRHAINTMNANLSQVWAPSDLSPSSSLTASPVSSFVVPHTSLHPPAPSVTVGADILISLLILVVIRSDITTFDSQLSYMRKFSFIDVQTGNVGYAISSLEAVLFHIIQEPRDLIFQSNMNYRLWAALRNKENPESEISSFFEHPTVMVPSQESDKPPFPLSLSGVFRSRNQFGESPIMMAVQSENPKALQELVRHKDIYPMEYIISDSNKSRFTLLSAAIQAENMQCIDIILDLLSTLDETIRKRYFAITDEWQRTVGHYLFHLPQLIGRIGDQLDWAVKDQNGQTPLFALCRCYDHAHYSDLIKEGFEMATYMQPLGGELRVRRHVDNRGNTLLHIIKDPDALGLVLQSSCLDVNQPNHKGLTALMVNAKYARQDAIKLLCTDSRIDVEKVDPRGLNAAEMAKNEETRHLLYEIILFSRPPLPLTAMNVDHPAAYKSDISVSVLRPQFTDDNIYFTVMSGIPHGSRDNIVHGQPVTCVRRSFSDFLFLHKWLSYEHPSSWMPRLQLPRNPFAIPARPSRTIVHDIQVSLDAFLQCLLLHPTFSTHELVWEFLLLSELSIPQLTSRSKLKAENRIEELRETSLMTRTSSSSDTGVTDVETFVEYARSEMADLDRCLWNLYQAIVSKSHKSQDLTEALKLMAFPIKAGQGRLFLEPRTVLALEDALPMMLREDSECLSELANEFWPIAESSRQLLAALQRPELLISTLASEKEKLLRWQQILVHPPVRWPIPITIKGIEASRSRVISEAESGITDTIEYLEQLRGEIRESHVVLACELAGFQRVHERQMQSTIGTYASHNLRKWKQQLVIMEDVLTTLRLSNRQSKL